MGSTNDWLRQNAARLPDGQWLRADRQTAGRGRMGRQWQSPDGNLAASCLIRLQTGETNPPELAFVAALALYDAVASLVAPGRLLLKWPNDLMLDGGKLSGILLEREGGTVILGIGVNLASAPDVPGRTTASLLSAGVVVTAEAFAPLLSAAFAERRGAWRAHGFAGIREAWMARAHPPGTALNISSEGRVVAGRYAAIDADGALLLDGDDGKRHRVVAGDVWWSGPVAGGVG